ncbi:putative uncharacterized protein FLJ45840 isoform X1 [Nycticebus coucang]|uniref:putative uncharacterized protein FLJ45840 isoform X1 n=1 Tax=Nycticebus coucang TaxID=9470 RepID=UPI00234C8719|nr:putative uncharacterized protein FLJ45840 isoform X1 [Nycticebus coucang]
MQTCSGKGIKMAFLDVQSSSTPQSLPLLLFSHREGGGRGAGDPGAPAVVPAPVSAPRPASSPARSETRSPPLTLISRHITCCSCESPGDVLLSGRRGGGGLSWGRVERTAVPACPPRRPGFTGVTAVAIQGWMKGYPSHSRAAALSELCNKFNSDSTFVTFPTYTPQMMLQRSTACPRWAQDAPIVAVPPPRDQTADAVSSTSSSKASGKPQAISLSLRGHLFQL